MEGYWNKFLKWVTGVLKMGVLVLGVVVLWLIMMNQLDQFVNIFKADKESIALKECMVYGVPDTLLFEGETYCIGNVQTLGSDGTIRGFRLAVKLEIMERMFGKP